MRAQQELLLTADARLDNRQDLTETLTTKRHGGLEHATDADLILAAYQCWDSDCAAHLIGDFAFAIWDAPKQRLFAARDAMAMRPLYYRVEPRRALFVTEIKQLVALPDVPVRLYEPAVSAHLAGLFGPLSWTCYAGIIQLEPAHALVIDASGHRTWRYWDIDPDAEIRYPREADYAEHFMELFQESVRCRLRSVKPVGLLLSGGLDSGGIASTVGSLLQHGGVSPAPDFHTYCFAFETLTECDERHLSDHIVRRYGFVSTDVPAEAAAPLMGFPNHGPDRDEPYMGAFHTLHEHAYGQGPSGWYGTVVVRGSWRFDDGRLAPRLCKAVAVERLVDVADGVAQPTSAHRCLAVSSRALASLLAAAVAAVAQNETRGASVAHAAVATVLRGRL